MQYTVGNDHYCMHIMYYYYYVRGIINISRGMHTQGNDTSRVVVVIMIMIMVVVVVVVIWWWYCSQRSLHIQTTPPTTMVASVAPRGGCTRGIYHMGSRGCVGLPLSGRMTPCVLCTHTHAHTHTHLHARKTLTLTHTHIISSHRYCILNQLAL